MWPNAPSQMLETLRGEEGKKEKGPAMNWVTADHHFGHDAIIKYCKRPFKNAKDMDYQLIERHNEVVAPEDVVYFVGDFTMSGNPDYIESLLRRLNGFKHLILGNHDRLKPFTYVDLGFTTVHTALEIHTPFDKRVILAHDPAVSAVDRDARFLCGHVHDLFLTCYNVVNVGVDIWHYRPIKLYDAVQM
jgi:calcineurin-like phosphoesterase family protein